MIPKSSALLRSFRYLLWPFSFLYGILIRFRNWLFDKQILSSASFNFPIICVGNLAVGGTGKTPMTEYLVTLLQPRYQVATLSRGYKRKTKGFAIADDKTTAIDIGDEPMQFHQKFPGITVAVGEERIVAIPQILHLRPETKVIILDDAFQHRHVKAGLNILLTDYKNLFTRDLMLPAGDLRDVPSSSRRADIIVVTKCPSDINEEEKKEIIKEINPKPHQKIYFAEIVYDQPYHVFSQQPGQLHPGQQVLLLCGIANPKPLKDFLTRHVQGYDMIRYADHHIFTTVDLAEIKSQFEKMDESKRVIITTEKDAMRLQKFKQELAGFPIYVLPIRHRFLFGETESFHQQITSFVEQFPTNP